MNLAPLKHQAVIRAKKLLYGRRGEPYEIAGHRLRYIPGSRPVRLRYANSAEWVARYDALEVAWLAANLTRGSFAVDIGAHNGSYTLLMAALCGTNGTVVAFEPDPYSRKVLLQNLGLNPAVNQAIVEPLACSDTDGEAILFSRGGNAQSSLVRSGVEFSPDHSSEAIHVNLVTLDSYLQKRGLPLPQCVKIDAEGAEIRILKGAETVLAGEAHILCELHPYAWPEFNNSFDELVKLARDHGRRIRYLDDSEEFTGVPKYGVVLLERSA